MNFPKRVRLVEVGPRDGLQNEAKPVSVEAKVRLIDALSAAGHSAVEAGSFVSPKWVPQMANTDQVMARIKRKPGVSYPVLVPNKQGMNGAVEARCEEIAIFTANGYVSPLGERAMQLLREHSQRLGKAMLGE